MHFLFSQNLVKQIGTPLIWNSDVEEVQCNSITYANNGFDPNMSKKIWNLKS